MRPLLADGAISAPGGCTAQGHLQLDGAHRIRRRAARAPSTHTAGQRVGAQKCDQRHTAGDRTRNANVIHSRHQLLPCARHGGLCLVADDYWAPSPTGGAASLGLRDAGAYDSGVVRSNVNDSAETHKALPGRAVRAAASEQAPATPGKRSFSVSRTRLKDDAPV